MIFSLKVYIIFCFFISISEVVLMNVSKYKWPWVSLGDFIGFNVLSFIYHSPFLLIIFLVFKFFSNHKTKIIVALFLFCYISINYYFLPYTWVIDNFEIWVEGKPGKDFLFYFSFKIISIFFSIILALKISKNRKVKI